jgi:hypothetical protein
VLVPVVDADLEEAIGLVCVMSVSLFLLL